VGELKILEKKEKKRIENKEFKIEMTKNQRVPSQTNTPSSGFLFAFCFSFFHLFVVIIIINVFVRGGRWEEFVWVAC
jgi:hypothetical protein